MGKHGRYSRTQPLRTEGGVMNGMTVCSGIGAPEVAAPFIDWQFQSEIEKFPSAVLAARFPHAKNLGDMTKFKDWPDAAIDILAGGTPCQSFSIAGLRKGMADPRGNLALTYLAIADRYRPQWLLWENVPGVLSSNGGRDFGSILGGMAELGYGTAYCVLDAQFVRVESHPRAVPQRRRRVFVVGCLGDWRRAAAVLFERESLSGNSAPRREARQGFTRGTEIGPAGGRYADVNPTLDARAKDGPIRNQIAGAVLCADVAPTLNAHFGEKQGLEDQHIRGGVDCSLPPTAMCLNAGAMGRQDAESETLIPTTGGGFDVAHTLLGKSNDSHAADLDNYVCDTLVANGDAHSGFRDEKGLIPVAHAYDTRNGMAPHGSMQGDVISQTLRAKEAEPPLVTYPLQSNFAVRRLTPTECERLQGFPDGHTAITFRGKPAADGPRYKSLGNAMAVNCMNWILTRINNHHNAFASQWGATKQENDNG
jgi:DNA (cytosine-5)-methyltransferase 1